MLLQPTAASFAILKCFLCYARLITYCCCLCLCVRSHPLTQVSRRRRNIIHPSIYKGEGKDWSLEHKKVRWFKRTNWHLEWRWRRPQQQQQLFGAALLLRIGDFEWAYAYRVGAGASQVDVRLKWNRPGETARKRLCSAEMGTKEVSSKVGADREHKRLLSQPARQPYYPPNIVFVSGTFSMRAGNASELPPCFVSSATVFSILPY